MKNEKGQENKEPVNKSDVLLRKTAQERANHVALFGSDLDVFAPMPKKTRETH